MDGTFLVLIVEHTLFNRWDNLPLHFHLQFRRHLLSLDWNNNPWWPSRLQVQKTWLDGPYLKAGCIFHKFRSETSELLTTCLHKTTWRNRVLRLKYLKIQIKLSFFFTYCKFCRNENYLVMWLSAVCRESIRETHSLTYFYRSQKLLWRSKFFDQE